MKVREQRLVVEGERYGKVGFNNVNGRDCLVLTSYFFRPTEMNLSIDLVAVPRLIELLINAMATRARDDEGILQFDKLGLVANGVERLITVVGHTEEAGEVCTADCLGCNDPIAAVIRDLNEARALAFQRGQGITAREDGVEWTDEFPTTEGGFYWVRHKLNHDDLDIGSLLNGSLYFTYGGPTSKSPRKDYEYLGPVYPDQRALK
jgi:hypothetical protein